MNTVELNALSKAQVLSMLKISERTLENLVRDQRLPAGVKIGRGVYWSPVVVQKWWDAQFETQLRFIEKTSRRMVR